MELEPPLNHSYKPILISRNHEGNSVFADLVFAVYNMNSDFTCDFTFEPNCLSCTLIL